LERAAQIDKASRVGRVPLWRWNRSRKPMRPVSIWLLLALTTVR
jgi:hypothetical protein